MLLRWVLCSFKEQGAGSNTAEMAYAQDDGAVADTAGGTHRVLVIERGRSVVKGTVRIFLQNVLPPVVKRRARNADNGKNANEQENTDAAHA